MGSSAQSGVDQQSVAETFAKASRAACSDVDLRPRARNGVSSRRRASARGTDEPAEGQVAGPRCDVDAGRTDPYMDRSSLGAFLLSAERAIARTRKLISAQRALIAAYEEESCAARDAVARLNALYEMMAVYSSHKLRALQELGSPPAPEGESD